MMNEREQFIIEYVRQNRFATPVQLSELLHVSPITIRRDIDRLDQADILHKVHGGVIFQKPELPKTLDFRSEQKIEEKRRIAKYIAKNVVKPGNRIFMDAGSTTRYIAEEIIKIGNLTIVTHSMSIIDIVKEDKQNRLVIVGGEYDKRLRASIGPLVEDVYQSLMADIAFIGASAINLDVGCYDNIGSEKHIKRIMNRNAKQSYLVLDGSKFHTTAGLFQSLRIDEVKNIITTADECDPVICEHEANDINFLFVPKQMDSV